MDAIGVVGARREARVPFRTGMLALVGSLVLMMATPGVADAQSTPEEEAAALARPAIVYIEATWSAYVQDHEGDWLNEGEPFTGGWTCTGFVVNPSGYVATAGHCTDGAQEMAVMAGVDYWVEQGWATAEEAPELFQTGMMNWKVEGENSGSPPAVEYHVQHGKATSGMSTGEAWPARLIESKPMEEGDVALLKVEQSNLPVVELASSEDVAIGTPILSIGYPGTSDLVVDATLEPTFKDGKISSSKTREGGLIPVYEISAAVSGGMSGGPTVDLDGRVVGINSFGINSQIETQQFNFVSPSTLLSEMLARNGVVNELGPVDTLYREGLDLFYAGSYAAAIETFDEVLDRVPSHQQAQEFRVRAANAGPDTAPEEPEAVADEPAADSSGGGISPLVLVGGLVALLVIGGLAFVVARSRGRSKKDAPPQSPSAPVEPVATPQAAPEHPAAGNGAPAPVGAPEPQPVSAGVNGEPAPVTERQPLGFAAPSPEQSAPAAVAPPASVFCVYCGTAGTPGAPFCAQCGQPVAGPMATS